MKPLPCVPLSFESFPHFILIFLQLDIVAFYAKPLADGHRFLVCRQDEITARQVEADDLNGIGLPGLLESPQRWKFL